MGKDVIIACDFGCKEEAISFLDRFTEEKPYVKIGKELYYAEGPDICREIKSRGHKIFLDLKLPGPTGPGPCSSPSPSSPPPARTGCAGSCSLTTP